jgi:hypothetical protein
MLKQRRAAKNRPLQRSKPANATFASLTTINARRNWAIFTLTICMLVAWNYWAPFAFMNPFAVPPLPFAMYGTSNNDFHMYYLAGKMWLAHTNPYVEGGIIYPPPSVPFFGLFALLDFSQATTAWALTYFLTFVVAICCITTTLEPQKRLVFVAIAFLLLFTSYPFLVLFGMGQIDLLLSSLTALSLAAYRLNHPSISASVLAAATLLKGPPVLFLIYFVLFNRDLWYLVRFIAATSAIVGASLLIVPVDLYARYLGNPLGAALAPLALPSNQSIPGVLAMMGLDKIVPIVSFTGLGLFAIFALTSSRKPNSFDDGELRQNSIFLMNALAMLLFGAKSTVYPYVWVIIPVAMFLCTLLVNGIGKSYLITVCAATFLLNAVLSTDLFNFRTLPLELLGNIAFTISLIKIHLRPN